MNQQAFKIRGIVHRLLLAAHRGRTLLVCLLSLGCFTSTFSQLSTVYVDATNGSDSYSGANAANSPSGTGPKATIHAGLNALADQGRLVLMAGVYAGDGVDTDGSPSLNADNADINISTTKYPRLGSGLTIELRALGLNNEIRVFADANSVYAANGALITHTSDQYIPNLIFNIPGGVLKITTTTGAEYLTLAGQHSSGSPVSSLYLTSGSIDIQSSSVVHLRNGASMVLAGSARFLHFSPQIADSLNLTYTGGGSFTAGSEAGYGLFGSGVITVNKDPGTTITFPAAMSFGGNRHALLLQSGNAVFNGVLTLGSQGSSSQSPSTADIIISTVGTVNFNAPVSLVVGNSPASDNAISTIDNASDGAVIFQQPVTWIATYNSGTVSFPATESTALIWNGGAGTMMFAGGITLSHAGTTVNNGPVTVDVRILNNGAGRLTFVGPVSVIPRTETSVGAAQQFSVGAINNAGGTLEISGTLRSGLSNAPTTATGGVININGATSLGSLGAATGNLINAPNKTINLLSNTLTLNGSANVSLLGSTIGATTGGLVVKATGAISIDGGSLPGLTLDQGSTGSTTFTNTANLTSLSIVTGTFTNASSLTVGGSLTILGGTCLLKSTVTLGSGLLVSGGSCSVQALASIKGDLSLSGGVCSIQSGTTITGGLTVSGGTMFIQSSSSITGSITINQGTCWLQSATTAGNALVINGGTCSIADSASLVIGVGDFRQAGGVFNLGGSRGGELRILGNFSRSSGTINAGLASTIAFIGSTLQSLDPGPALQLASIGFKNATGGVRLVQPIRISRTLTIDANCSLLLGSSSIVMNGEGASFTNNGSFTGSGPCIIMGGVTSTPGGTPLSHSEIHAGAQSSFSSFMVDVGTDNTCSLKALANVTWTGNLVLSSGSLDIASSIDFGPAGPGSTMTRDVVNSRGITLSSGTFNASNIRHALHLVGDLQSTIPLAADLVNDLPNTDSLIVDVNSDTSDRDADLSTGQPRYLQFPGRAFSYAGSLRIGPLAAVQLAPNGKGGDAFELNGTNIRHIIRGILTTADPGDSLYVSGAIVSIQGSQLPHDAALLGGIAISSNSSCTITDVKGVHGNFSALPRSVVSLSLGESVSDQKIQGQLTLSGSNFVLLRSVEVTGGIAFNSGLLNLGLSNLVLTTWRFHAGSRGRGIHNRRGLPRHET